MGSVMLVQGPSRRVLGGSGQLQRGGVQPWRRLVLGDEPVQADDTFEVEEEHLDRLSSSPGRDLGVSVGDIPGHLARAFVP